MAIILAPNPAAGLRVTTDIHCLSLLFLKEAPDLPFGSFSFKMHVIVMWEQVETPVTV